MDLYYGDYLLDKMVYIDFCYSINDFDYLLCYFNTFLLEDLFLII